MSGHLGVYNRIEVAAQYAALSYLTPCEKLLFDTFLRPGIAILDLGVGGGRTTPYLSSLALRYVGVDYAAEMIAACQRKFPGKEFVSANATNLGVFGDQTFDAVVMAFNGIDHVIPDEARRLALWEIWRVLKPGGMLIFSSHNPRAILVRAGWNRERIHDLAHRTGRGNPTAVGLVTWMLSALRVVLAWLQSAARSVPRIIQRVPSRVFWRGEGYFLDSAHGGMLTHYATPKNVVEELGGCGFHPLRRLGDDYPRNSWILATDWYYYVFAKGQVPVKGGLCA